MVQADADRKAAEAKTSDGAMGKAMATGFRVASELLAGVLVGAFIGWWIDRWLGSSPIALIVLTLVGTASGSGTSTVLRRGPPAARTAARLEVSRGRRLRLLPQRRGWLWRAKRIDPIHQFEITRIGPQISVFGNDISLTNSGLFMFIVVGVVRADHGLRTRASAR